MLQQYEKSSIALNPEALGTGRFGKAYLAKVPYCPDEVVVKIATTSTAVEKLRDIGYEIDGLMRVSRYDKEPAQYPNLDALSSSSSKHIRLCCGRWRLCWNCYGIL